jgi:integrase
MEVMQKLIESYLSDLELYHRSPRTIKVVKSILCNFAQEKNILKVNADDIKIWLRSLNENISIQSQSQYLQHISKFYDHLIEENKYKERNPCKKILRELNKAPTNRIRETTILSVEDVRKIVLKASNPSDRSMILLFYKTGMRISELQSLKIKDIDFDNKEITIQKRKGGKKGIVLFDDECKRWLKAHLGISGDIESLYGINVRRIQLIVNEIGKRAGIEHLKPHDFRHAFTSHLQEASCHPEVIRKLRGDSSGDMVSYYTHFSDDKNREEYEMCIPKLGG